MFIKVQEKWYLPKPDGDCWTGCRGKAGECAWCGQKGYCCSGTKLNLNGNCPSDSVTYLATKTKSTSHICVAERNGKK